ncbi:MAG: PAS domain S-box protein [Nitrospina sp.]|nr:PAS domain S-box protein [Nitrospina sp.]
MALYGNPYLSGKEQFFDENEVIVSKTDLKGNITYANRTFFKLAAVTEEECLGVQHNLVRNPTMPRCLFKHLWDTLKSGKEIFAYVNNRSSAGDSYWVFAHVTPSRNSQGEIVGYHSNRRVPNRKVVETHIIPLYEDLLATEKSYSSPDQGLQASMKKVDALLKEKKMSFNEFMFSLGV